MTFLIDSEWNRVMMRSYIRCQYKQLRLKLGLCPLIFHLHHIDVEAIPKIQAVWERYLLITMKDHK